MLSFDRHRLQPGWAVLALAGALAPAPARASGVDGAARIVVVPWVVAGLSRESLSTVFNPGPEAIQVEGLYVGGEGTPARGPHACTRLDLQPEHTRTVPLSALCPDARVTDAENWGYLELTSGGDSRLTFSASSWVETDQGHTFAVEGYPVGAFDPSQSNDDALRVLGLRGEVVDPANPQPIEERLVCFVATRDESKDVKLGIDRGHFGQTVPVSLAPRQMQRIDLLVAAGFPPGRHTDWAADVFAADPALVIAGCGIEDVSTNTLDWHPAQTRAPLDGARQRHVESDTGVFFGPYAFAYSWGTPAAPVKVVLSTYLQTDDHVRCRLIQPVRLSPNFDPTPWLELRVVDPDGVVRAGGDRAIDTGEFVTGVRNGFAGGYRNRWSIEISLDEASQAAVPYPGTLPGVWGVACDSAAGMSTLLPVGPHAGGGFADDF
jgi:hypothetical protein